ncbi:MAG: glycosyltransferase family 39 protein [Anaerolineales bacterium]
MSANNLLSPIRTSFQERCKLAPAICLVLVLLLGVLLRFYNLGAGGVGNTYYAAAVKSMLMSWHNFFFVAFEPGGSVSVDKPPLGFWVQALSAHFLGVTGFALALPNAIAGLLSIFMVYQLIRRPFGVWAGVAAALTLAIMPVAVATERNNTIDGLLVFVLLLAAWAFLQAVYTKKVSWLFLGAFIVGLGFNIKMLQAFLPLPAFYAVYFFGAKQKWGKKMLHLAAATALLLVVSFSWAIAVDLVPAAERPYVDSTSQNTVMELIFGHNGIERLTNLRQQIGLDGGGPLGPAGAPANGGVPQPPTGQNLLPAGSLSRDLPRPPAGQGIPPGPGNGQSGPGNGGGRPSGGPGMDFGNAGSLRLFTQPLVGEASWLLPFVLGGLVMLALALWKQPFDAKSAALILWAGWLIPEAIYFTYSTGLMHAYYLIMLGAPMAALAAMTAWAGWQVIQKHPLPGFGLLFLLVSGTLVFQGFTLWGTTSLAPWAIGAAWIFFGLGLCFFALSRLKVRFAALAFSLLLAAMLFAPALWSALTTFNPSQNSGLPAAGPANQAALGGMPTTAPQQNGIGVDVDQSLLAYLFANTQPGTYLLATDRASDAAPYILASGRPVLTFGGFLGQYNEVSVDQLAALVKSGKLRFVLSQGLDGYQGIAQWVRKNCTAANISSLSSFLQASPWQNQGLYDCERLQ